MSNFIGIYPDALGADFCQRCISKFERSHHKTQGETGNGVDLAKKRSTDITVSAHSEWQEEMLHLQNVVLAGLTQYVRAHPFMLAGAVSLMAQDETGALSELTYPDIEKMDDATLAEFIKVVYRLGSVNLQKYQQDKGGYFHWHSEHYPHPNDPNQDCLHRTLLWMFYLNDVEDGGETEFYFQDVQAKPKQGTLLIAPAGFTHTHRGVTPRSTDKYIFTSWVLYQQTQNLYGG